MQLTMMMLIRGGGEGGGRGAGMSTAIGVRVESGNGTGTYTAEAVAGSDDGFPSRGLGTDATMAVPAVAVAEAGVGAPDDVAMKTRCLLKKIKRSCLYIITERS